jgi:predicted Zn-ribbon and HTH transcriptional regulator
MSPSLKSKILDVLQSSDTPLSSRKIAELAGCHYQNADSALVTLVYQGKIQRRHGACPCCSTSRLLYSKKGDE